MTDREELERKRRELEEAARRREKAAQEEQRRRIEKRDVGKGGGSDQPGPYED